jgi:hypothetical protein
MLIYVLLYFFLSKYWANVHVKKMNKAFQYQQCYTDAVVLIIFR